MRQITYLFLIVTMTAFAQKNDKGYSITKKDSLYFSNLPRLKYAPNYNRAPMPYAHDNSTSEHFRPIFQQTSLDCGQASSVGLCFTYEINASRNVPGNIEENQYPSFFVYNFQNEGTGWSGVSYMHTFEVLKYAGTPNVETYGGMHYGDDSLWVSGYDTYYNAMQNRIYNAYQIYIETPEDLQLLKQWINNHASGNPNGGCGVFYSHSYSTSVLDVLPTGTEEAGKYVVTNWGYANHAMTIVGYNDSIKWDYNNDGQYTNNIDINGDGEVTMKDWEIGALKFANTYAGGPNFANGGTAYMMYKTLADDYGDGGIWNHSIHVMKVKEQVNPLLTAKISLFHNQRNELKVTIGYSTNLSATEPEFEMDFPIFNHQGGNFFMQGGHNNLDARFIEFGLDISRLLNYIPNNQDVKYFVTIYDEDPEGDGNGYLNYFSVIDYSTGNPDEIWSTDTLVPLNNNAPTRMSVIKSLNVDLPNITTTAIPPATLYENYSQLIEAENGTSPYFWDIVHHYHTSYETAVFPTNNTNSISFDGNNNAVIDLDFEFPFYGQKFNKAIVNSDGYVMFTYEYYPWPYDHEGIFRFYKIKTIAPLLDLTSGANAWYEMTSNYLQINWSGSGNDFACKIYDDGNIEFYYNNITLPSTFKAGLSQGDTRNFQLLEEQQITGSTKVLFEYPKYPIGLDIDTRTGEFKGTLEETYSSLDITFQVLDNNFLLDQQTIPFYSEGIIINHAYSSVHGEELHYGDTVYVDIELNNTFSNDLINCNINLSIADNNFNALVDSYNVGDILSGETLVFDDVFSFIINDTIPNLYPFEADILVSSNSGSWSKPIIETCYAPEISIINTAFIDGGDNILDPGETGDLIITYKNIGGSKATTLEATYTPTDAYITINSTSNDTKAELLPDSTWDVTLNITADASTPEGFVSTIDSDIDGDKSFHSDNEVYVGIGLIVENWETGTTDQFPWGFDGEADWYIDNTTVHEGNYALRSGVITHNETSTLSLAGTVGTSGNISFYKKVSSESNYDYLRFYIDGVQTAEWSGDMDWAEHIFPVTAGFHTFEWKYEKDFSVSSGSDAAWIDYIVFPAIDFSPAIMQVSVSSVEKWMAPSETDTDTIFVTNIGGSILNYTATIDNATISSPPSTNNNIISNRSVEGSTLTPNTTSIITGAPFTIDISLYNGSPDNEWIEGLVLSLPLGVNLDSASHIIGGSGGAMEWDGTHGNGSDVSWFGEQSDGWGVLHNGETATATLYLTIDEAIQNSVIIQYQINGEGYAADPHTISDFLVFTNNGTNDTWLTLDNPSGGIISNQNGEVYLNFNTYGIPEGTYNCNINIASNVSSIDVPVILHVVDVVDVEEIANQLNIYPIPANHFFNIEMPNNKESSLEIFDATGRVIEQKTDLRQTYTVNSSHWEEGLYLVVVHQNNKRYTKQVIIE